MFSIWLETAEAELQIDKHTQAQRFIICRTSISRFIWRGGGGTVEFQQQKYNQ